MDASSRARFASSGGQPALAQQVDVRAGRGQRRAQLVRGVRDETALAADGLLERREHRVEARAEPAELVVPGDRDALGQVAGRGDVLGRGREAPDRLQSGRRDECRERGREGDADAADEEDPEPDPGERVRRRCERIDRDDGAAAGPAIGATTSRQRILRDRAC